MKAPSAAVEWVRDGLDRRARALDPDAKISVDAEWLADDDCWRLLVSLRAPGGKAHAFVRIAPGSDSEAAVALVAPKLPDLFRMAAETRR